MNFLQLQNTVFELMRDPLKTKFNVSFIQNWLNEGERIYCAKTNYNIQKSIALQVVPGSQEIALPADFKAIIAVFYTTDKFKLREIDIEQSITNYVGKPTGYYIRNGMIGWEGTPNSFEDLTVLYYSTGGGMVLDSDNPITPVDHHMSLVWYCCYLCSIQADDARVNYFMKNFEQEITDSVRQQASSREMFPIAGEVNRAYTNKQDHDTEFIR